MKSFLFSCCILFLFNFSYNSQEKLAIEGYYQGINIHLKNPSNNDGFGFCINKITVNGDVFPVSLGNSTITVNLKPLNLKIGSEVVIIIDHNSGCLPEFINAEVLRPNSTFDIVSISASKDGKLKWKTKNENGKLAFIVEQYKWDKWVPVGEVNGMGTNNQSYEFNLSPHSGKNEVRVCQIDKSLKKRASKSVTFISTVTSVTKSPTKVKKKINFSSKGVPAETYYQIFDAYGNIIMKGFGSSVNCSKIVNGLYYINFDNKTEKFIKN